MSPEPILGLYYSYEKVGVACANPEDLLYSIKVRAAEGREVGGSDALAGLVEEVCDFKEGRLSSFFAKLPGFEPALWTGYTEDGISAAFLGLDPKKADQKAALHNAQKTFLVKRFPGQNNQLPSHGKPCLEELRLSWVRLGSELNPNRVMTAVYTMQAGTSRKAYRLWQFGLSVSQEEYSEIKKEGHKAGFFSNFEYVSSPLSDLGHKLFPVTKYPGIITPAMRSSAGEDQAAVLLLLKDGRLNQVLDPCKVKVEDNREGMSGFEIPTIDASFQIPFLV